MNFHFIFVKKNIWREKGKRKRKERKKRKREKKVRGRERPEEEREGCREGVAAAVSHRPSLSLPSLSPS